MAAKGFVRHSGQGCGTPTRPNARCDDVVARWSGTCATCGWGSGRREHDDGPLIREAQRTRAERYSRVASTKADGRARAAADRTTNGATTSSRRCLRTVRTRWRSRRTRSSAPSPSSFPSTVDDAVRIANDSRYGSCPGRGSEDVAKAYDVAATAGGDGQRERLDGPEHERHLRRLQAERDRSRDVRTTVSHEYLS